VSAQPEVTVTGRLVDHSAIWLRQMIEAQRWLDRERARLIREGYVWDGVGYTKGNTTVTEG